MSSSIQMYTYSMQNPGLTKRDKDTSELARMKMTCMRQEGEGIELRCEEKNTVHCSGTNCRSFVGIDI